MTSHLQVYRQQKLHLLGNNNNGDNNTNNGMKFGRELSESGLRGIRRRNGWIYMYIYICMYVYILHIWVDIYVYIYVCVYIYCIHENIKELIKILY